MQRLKVRVYRPIGKGDTWAMVGTTDHPQQVQAWLNEYSGKELIFHTGFSVLPRETMASLLPHSHLGVVFCAATKALMPDLFASSQINVCYGFDEDGFTPLSNISEWFFAIPKHAQEESVPHWWLVSNMPTNSGEGQDVNWHDNNENLSAEFRKALADQPELLADLLRAEIFCLEDFREHWKKLPEFSALKIASTLMEFGREPFVETLFNGQTKVSKPGQSKKTTEAMEQCEAIIKLVRYVPPWQANMPTTPVRLYNAFMGSSVQSLYDMEDWGPVDILKVPNLGKTSMRALLAYLMTLQVQSPIRKKGKVQVLETSKNQNTNSATIPAFTVETLPTLSDLIGNALNTIEDKNSSKGSKRLIRILRQRFSGETLETIGEKESLTRERIRQIAKKSLKLFSEQYHINHEEAFLHLHGFTSLVTDIWRKNDCSQVDFSNLVRIFSETDSLQLGPPQRRILEEIFSDLDVRFFSFDLGAQEITLPVPSSITESALDRIEDTMKDVRDQVRGKHASEAEEFAQTQFFDLLGNQFFASVFAIEFILYRSSLDADGKVNTMATERTQLDHAIGDILHLLRQAGRPLHGVEEIYPAMPEVYQRSVNDRRVAGHINEHQDRCLGTSSDFIFTMGRGRYALWEHFGVTDEHGRKCADFIEQFLSQNSDRQFSDQNLYDVIKGEGLVTWRADHVDRHRIVSAILMRYRPSNVRYMGRFVWSAGAWTDQKDAAGRYQIHELIEECIKEQGRPVPKRKLDEYISAVRGRGIGDQYHEQHGLVRLSGTGKNTLYWHESLDPEPYDSPAVKALRSEITDLLETTSSSGMFMNSLKADITKHSDVVGNYNTAQFLALLLRMPDVKVGKNQQNQLVVSVDRSSSHA